MATALLARAYDEDEGTDWKNYGNEWVQKELGSTQYDALMKSQFEDVPDMSGTSRGGMGLRQKFSKLFSSSSVPSRRGAPTPRPVGGAGFATVVNHPKFPDNDYFRAGRHFPVILRHSNFCHLDDSVADGRVAALKLGDGPESLDLVLHTGRVAPYHNAVAYEQFVTAFASGNENDLKKWCFDKPSSYSGRVENLRYLPTSYYDQRYHSHVTYELICTDGLRHLVRLRLIPASGLPETGRLTKEQQSNVWSPKPSQEADDANPRPHDYLRVEYQQRLESSALQYRLQIQAREWRHLPKAANPCQLWNVRKHPWMDLAVVTIPLPITAGELVRYRFCLFTHPPTFRLPDTSSKLDFFSLAHAMRTAYSGAAPSAAVKSAADGDRPTRKYVVTVATGTAPDAGTDADVTIVLTGSKCRSRPIGLDTPFYDDFESGQTDVFEVEAVDVGVIIMVTMTMTTVIPGRHWLLNYVSVTDVLAEKTARFPCYQWLSTSQPCITLRKSDALLANQELTPYCYMQRKYELGERRKMYQWEKVFGLPSRLKADRYEDIPRELRLQSAKERDFKVKYVQTLAATGVGSIKSMFDTWDPLTDSDKLLTSLLKDKATVKKVAVLWRNDAEFGRQLLNGPHPYRIRRMTKELISFPVKEEHVADFLDRGLTLKEEMKAGHVYMVSYPELTPLAAAINHLPKAKRFVVAPMCMLYVRSNGQLVPIAIQLEQKSGPHSLLFTPHDDQWDWLNAKVWVRLADAQLHQIEARQLRLHLVVEAFTVATMRHLPAVHPVHKLLVPHLRYAVAVNHFGRKSLFQGGGGEDGGLFDKLLSVGGHTDLLLKESYRRFRLTSLNLPRDLAERGVDDPVLLPGYHFRQDGLALWGVIKKFVRTILTLSYWTGANVAADEELQAWAADLRTNALPQWEEGSDHGVPGSLETLDELLELVTSVIFTASAHNAAVTAPMMDYYGFPPNAPTMLVEPPPFEKGTSSFGTLQQALPSKGKTAEIIAVCYTLSRATKDQISLGEYPDQFFSGDAILATIEAFREDLKNLVSTIAARNEKLDIPYPYLSPDRVPANVS